MAQPRDRAARSSGRAARAAAGGRTGAAAGARASLRADFVHVRQRARAAVALWALLLLGVASTCSGVREIALGVALATVLVPIALIDAAVRLIPNTLTATGAAAALAIGLATEPAAVPGQLLAAALAGGLLLLAALARPGEMGMGDVKLAGMLGLFLGGAVAVALLVAFVAAALAGLVLAVRVGTAAARRATLPLGPFLALGAAVALLAGTPLLDAYRAAVGW